jgi:predicted ATP-grasp superfamily ATP-dependent carboligase
LPFAEIDPDEFFDFTEVRPEVSLVDGRTRQVLWPATSFAIARSTTGGPDLVIVKGPEPHLRWRTYTEAMVELVELLGVELVITLGAYLSEVTHGRPVPVNATSSDPKLAEDHGLSPSLYEGPTGIVGVLSAAFGEAGIPSMSVWASVPCYSLPTSPKAALALVRVVAKLVEREVDEEEISAEAAEYEERMDELVAEDENVAEYVARIEEMEEAIGAELSAEGLTEEIERFLRDGRHL